MTSEDLYIRQYNTHAILNNVYAIFMVIFLSF